MYLGQCHVFVRQQRSFFCVCEKFQHFKALSHLVWLVKQLVNALSHEYSIYRPFFFIQL